MTIVYNVEDWATLQPDLATLTPLHWKEIALNHNEVPLDPDWETYTKLANAGVLHCVSVRDDGKLVGYHLAMITGHLHYKSTKHAITDVFFILPEYRKGFVGVKLFQVVEREVRKLGVRKLVTATKKHLDISVILERLGFKPVETLFTKLLR